MGRKNNVIIGIDPGLANLGISLYPEKIAVTLTTHKKDATKARLAQIISFFATFIKAHKPGVVVMEDFFSFGPQKNTDSIGKVVGSVLGMCAVKSIPVVLYRPNDWLKILGLDGENHKEDTNKYILTKDWQIDSQHAADSAGMVEAYLKENK